MVRMRQAAGGGRVVEIAPDRLTGWINRFTERHQAIASMDASLSAVKITAADGATASLAVPFAPMRIDDAEPVEALFRHISEIGDVAAILVRERAYSVGVVRDGAVLASSTDTRYVQSRTAAGGWSQQRYARRRGNQRRDSYQSAADRAHRVLTAHTTAFNGLVVAGDATAIRTVLDDPRLADLADLPRRTFTDIAEPRRAVLDEVAVRCRTIEITIRDAGATSEK